MTRTVFPTPEGWQCLLLLVGASVLSPGAYAQSAIPSDTRCAECRIEFSHVTRLGSSDGEDFIEDDLLAVTATQDRIFVLPAANGAALVFDRNGRFVRRLGAEGRGPGEYLRPTFVLGLPDSETIVFDPMQGRAVVLDADLQVKRTLLQPAMVTDAIRLTNGKIIVNAQAPTPERFGLPFHVLVPDDGTIKSSFGEQAAAITRPEVLLRRLAPLPNGGMWAARRYEYLLERFDSEGVVVDSLRRTPAWFPGESAAYLGRPDTPPAPTIKAIHVDREGRIWVAAWVPSNNWASAWTGFDIPPNGEFRRRPTYNQLFSSQLEVSDHDGTLLVSQRWRGLPVAWVEDSVLATTYQDVSGIIFVDLWRTELVRQ